MLKNLYISEIVVEIVGRDCILRDLISFDTTSFLRISTES